MEKRDFELMKEAIEWASDCHPAKESIPKVGAVIAQDGKVIGRGRRGTGKEGDDDHAEWHAIQQVKDKSKLAGATLYTTLEPCTSHVRSKPLEAEAEVNVYTIRQLRKEHPGDLEAATVFDSDQAGGLLPFEEGLREIGDREQVLVYGTPQHYREAKRRLAELSRLAEDLRKFISQEFKVEEVT